MINITSMIIGNYFGILCESSMNANRLFKTLDNV